MILIVSNFTREAAALAALCETRSWPCLACASIAAFRSLVEKTEPRAVVTRHRFRDGYSDDLFSLLKLSGLAVMPKSIVLVAANFTARQEARQIALGADCVLRDPIRVDVLVEYLAKYRSPDAKPAGTSPTAALCFEFAGAQVFPHEHRVEHLNDFLQVTPREIEFLQILARSPGKVVSYHTLYAELLGRTFAGDTANLRVLLGKTAASFQRLRINLREVVQVIPKTGYQYLPKTSSRPEATRKPYLRAMNG
jgi:DNA-binding response OmpR family regulator